MMKVVAKMLFNEIYSLYYKTVGKIIESAIEGQLDDKTLRKIIADNGGKGRR